MKPFFAERNIVCENKAKVLLYTFVVRRQFLRECIHHWEFLFFDEKLLCVRRRDGYLDANPANSVQRKTCLQNMVNTYYTLFAVHSYFVTSSLFRHCLRIEYSGLNTLIAYAGHVAFDLFE